MTLPPDDELDPPKAIDARTLIKRFGAGAVAGLMIAAIQWSCYSYFVVEPLSLTRGITFCLVISIICGLMTLKWGYQTLESLFGLFG